jgi:hypothetical protein
LKFWSDFAIAAATISEVIRLIRKFKRCIKVSVAGILSEAVIIINILIIEAMSANILLTIRSYVCAFLSIYLSAEQEFSLFPTILKLTPGSPHLMKRIACVMQILNIETRVQLVEANNDMRKCWKSYHDEEGSSSSKERE